MFKKLILPDIKNKKRSKVLQHPALLGYAFFIFSLILSSYFVVLSVPGILGYATNVNTSDLLTYTNQKRADAGLKSLKINETLSKAAQEKANDMFNNNYWAHTSPSGKEPWDFIIASGYDYLYAGENLAVDFSESKKVVDAWYASPSHKANLLNDKYTEIGFAVVNGELEGRKTTLVVQMFGYPRQRLAQVASSETQSTKEKIIPIAEVEKAKTGEVNTNELSLAESPQNTPSTKIEENVTDKTEDLNLSESTTYANNTGSDLDLVSTGNSENGSVLNSSTVFSASKYIAIFLGLFLTLMFAFDGVYIRRYGVLRISGHTILHVLILVLAVAGIWYTSIGLVL